MKSTEPFSRRDRGAQRQLHDVGPEAGDDPAESLDARRQGKVEAAGRRMEGS